MIKYNENTINDWYFADDNIIKVYRNNAVCYYKITTSGGTSGQTPCYAVVDDISQYQDTEFVDVYDKATEKWYKLNNLNQYEEYGVYGNSISSGSTSRLPQGYTEVEYIRNSNYNAYINTGVLPFDNTTNTYTITARLTSEFHSNLSCATIISSEKPVSPYNGLLYRYKCSSTVDQLEFAGGNSNYSSSVVDNGDGTRTVTFQSTGATSWTTDTPLSFFCSFSDTAYTDAYRFVDATFYSATIVKNGVTARDYVPAKRDSDSVYGLYDLINNVFYTSPNGNNFSGGSAVTPTAATYYEGKLAIVDGYEYMYSGSSWQNIGELTGTSTVIKSPEYIRNTGSTKNGFIDLDYTLKDNSKFQLKVKPTGGGGGVVLGQPNDPPDNNDYRIFWYGGQLYYDYGSSRMNTAQTINTIYEYEIGNYYVKNMVTSQTVLTGTTKTGVSESREIYLWGSGKTDYADVYYLKIYEGNTLIKDMIPWTDMNGNYGLYDKVSMSVFHSTGQLTGSSNVTDVEVGTVVYPLYYTAKQDPPSGVTFSSMTEAEAYECPYVGLNASIDGTDYLFDVNYDWVTKYGLFPVTGEYICYNFDKYQKMEEKVRGADDTWSSQTPPVYHRGEMIESASTDCSHILPDVPFSVNYNAATYNASTKTFPRTYGQLVDVDAVISGSPSITVHDRYITYSKSGSYDGAFISDYQQYFNRTSSNPTLTIVAKAKTSSDSYCHLFANRYSTYNWMFRVRTRYMTLHGTSETGNIALNSSAANIMSARVNSSSQVYYNNWTLGTSTSPQSFSYGSTNNMKIGMFNGYAGYSTGEYFAGDFYWIYISQTELTDEQIQQVIDYNENL